VLGRHGWSSPATPSQHRPDPIPTTTAVVAQAQQCTGAPDGRRSGALASTGSDSAGRATKGAGRVVVGLARLVVRRRARERDDANARRSPRLLG